MLGLAVEPICLSCAVLVKKALAADLLVSAASREWVGCIIGAVRDEFFMWHCFFSLLVVVFAGEMVLPKARQGGALHQRCLAALVVCLTRYFGLVHASHDVSSDSCSERSLPQGIALLGC